MLLAATLHPCYHATFCNSILTMSAKPLIVDRVCVWAEDILKGQGTSGKEVISDWGGDDGLQKAMVMGMSAAWIAD